MDWYNEIDPYCADWLQNLIDAGDLPPGVVDRRSIEDVTPEDLRPYIRCHFFAGLGGWPLGLQLAGWPDDRPVWTGSCPCQPFAAQGARGGLADQRHLWPAWFHLIEHGCPVQVLGEQVESAIDHGWLDLVLSDLESKAYTFGVHGLPAASVGAPHGRPRLFWSASHPIWNEQSRIEQCRGTPGRMGRVFEPLPWNQSWQDALSRLRTLVHGLPNNVDATDAARNAIVPQVAARFIKTLMDIERET